MLFLFGKSKFFGTKFAKKDSETNYGVFKVCFE